LLFENDSRFLVECSDFRHSEEMITNEETEAGTSNGGWGPSLNSGFPPRRGWPIRSVTK
jgi:hypothetical protein